MSTSLSLKLPLPANAAEHAPQRRSFIKRASTGLAALGSLMVAAGQPAAQTRQASPARSTTPSPAGRPPADADNFYQSPAVTVRKVRFKNQYEMDVAGNLFVPNNLDRSSTHAAIVVGHPMGAVKEQSANLYATKMAEQGFVDAVDRPALLGRERGPARATWCRPTSMPKPSAPPSTTWARSVSSNRERIGVIGVCGSGSFVISAAKIDPRMKAIATVSMYDMGAANRHALNKSQTLAQRKALIAEAAQQRYVEFAGGETEVHQRHGARDHREVASRSSASSTTSTAPRAASTRRRANRHC